MPLATALYRRHYLTGLISDQVTHYQEDIFSMESPDTVVVRQAGRSIETGARAEQVIVGQRARTNAAPNEIA